MNNKKTYTAIDFTNYHAGKISSQEMHALEKAALEDDFLADALEGYVYNEFSADDLELLKKKIAAKNKNVFSLASFAQRKWIRIAAMLVIFLGLGYLFFNINKAPDEKALAKTESKKETTVSPDLRADSNKTQPDVTAPNVVSGNKAVTQTRNAPVLLNDAKEDQVAENAGPVASAPAIATLKLTEDNSNNSKYIAPTQDLKKVDDKGFLNSNTQNQSILNNNNQNQIGFENATNKKLGGPKQNNAFNNLNNNSNKNQINTNKPTFTIPVFDSTANGTIAFNDLYKKSEEKTFKILVPPVEEKETKNAELSEVVVTGNGNVKRKKEIAAASTTAAAKDVLAGKVAGIQVESVKTKAAPSLKYRVRNDADTGKLQFKESAKTFNDYVKKNIKPTFNDYGVEIKGTVTLSFKTNKNGKPVKIKIVQSLCSTCDEQAVQLLKDGPIWGRNINDRQQVSIEF
jgi:hypothetical protein